jgi:flagellar motor switch protein FliM
VSVTRREARLLSAAGRVGEALALLAPLIEAVVERFAGRAVSLKFIVPRTAADLKPELSAGVFQGVILRIRCVDPPITLFVLAPSTLCAALAGAVLGTGPAPAFTEPAVYEAVMAHLVGDVLRCLPVGLPLLRLDAITSSCDSAPLPDDGGIAVVFVRVKAGSITDLVTVALPAGSLDGIAASEAVMGTVTAPPAVLDLRFEVAAVVGSSRVGRADLRALEAGDVVVVDRLTRGIGPAGIEPAAGLDLAACVGPFPRFLARVEAARSDLRVTRGGPLIMEGDMQRDEDRTQIDESPGVPRPDEGLAHTGVRDLPAEVIVEAGRAALSVGDLLALAPGTVIPLGRPVSAEVTLTAGGRGIAHGVLVEVEGEIGVQVLKLIG